MKFGTNEANKMNMNRDTGALPDKILTDFHTMFDFEKDECYTATASHALFQSKYFMRRTRNIGQTTDTYGNCKQRT